MTQFLKKVSKDEVVEAGRALLQPKVDVVEKVKELEAKYARLVQEIQRLNEQNLEVKQALQAQLRGEQPKVVASHSPTAKR